MCSLRIGLVIDRLDPEKGGAEAYLLGLARYLVRQGHAVHHLARHFGPGVDAGSMQCVQVPPLPRAFRDVAFDRAAARLSTRLGLEVTLGVRHTPSTHVFQPHGGVYSRAAGAQSGSAGKSRWLHGLGRWGNPKHHGLLYLERVQCRQKSVTYVALSRRIQADMVQAYGLEGGEPVVIYNGVDPERFRPEASQEDRARIRRTHDIGDEAFLVLFVAHNFRLKGLDPLLESLAGLDRARLLVVGRDRAGVYRGLARSLGLEDRVRFVGSTRSPEPYYRAADVLAHPTWYDPCSIVCLEALASGLPVITTRANGVGELIAAEGGGRVLEEATDVAGLREAIAMLMEDATERQRLAGEARRLGESHPEVEAYAAMERVLVNAARERY